MASACSRWRGGERFPLHDADRRERSHDLRIHRIRRFLLYQLIDGLEVAVVVGWNRVERLPAHFDELRRRLWPQECPVQPAIGGRQQRNLTVEPHGDARAEATG